MKSTISDIERTAGQSVVAGFNGQKLPTEIETRLKQGALGGIILFGRNVESVQQVAALLNAAKRLSTTPLIIGVDQEGGRVVRLRAPMTVLPPARTIGALDEVAVTQQAGEMVGEELRTIGFNLNFAPVLDVDTHARSPVIGDRAFSSLPEQVSRHGIAFALGLKKGGVSPCAKHYPGHGDAALDSHLSLPTVGHDVERLTKVEELPFVRWMENGAGPMMSAHVVYPALDPEWPATLSAEILTRRVRERYRFNGVLFSDDLEMGAMRRFGDIGSVAIRAVEAGIDGLLICKSQEKQEMAVEALTLRAERDTGFLWRLKEAAGRLRNSVVTAVSNPLDWLGSPDHLSRQVALLDHFGKGTHT
jgi:beta-N-acetylhexosaminidase